ncbi:unnamed protein product, partial [Polarella glacialis]
TNYSKQQQDNNKTTTKRQPTVIRSTLRLVYRAREIASKFKDKNAYEIPVHYLALKLANIGQVYTQHAYMRPYGVSTMLVSIDQEKGPSLYQIDPAGNYYGYKAAAAGTKDQEAMNALEK